MHQCTNIVKSSTLNTKNIIFFIFDHYLSIFGYFLINSIYSKKWDFKKSHFFSNQEQNVEKFFLINFGIYVGYKKKLNIIFYHIKFSRNKNFCSITRKIDFLNIF
jgi:hypothetical protein